MILVLLALTASFGVMSVLGVPDDIAITAALMWWPAIVYRRSGIGFYANLAALTFIL